MSRFCWGVQSAKRTVVLYLLGLSSCCTARLLMPLALVWACFPARDHSPWPFLQTPLSTDFTVSVDCAHLRLPAAL